MGYTKDAVSGLTWMGTFRLVTRIFGYLRIAVLARLLTPVQFGLFGIASLVLSLLEKLTQTGINVVLMQEKDDIEKYVDTAWVVSIVRGTIVALIIVAFTPFVVRFFNAEGAYVLLLLVALVAFIRGFINPARVTYLKNLEFKKEFLFSTGIFFLDAIVAITIALIYKTPASLVWGLIAGAILEVFMSHIFMEPKPKLKFDMSRFKLILRRGKWVTGSVIFDYFFSEGDDMVVGKILNTQALGVYQMAYKISILPLTEVTKIVNQVSFPVYTRIEGDRERLKKAYLKITLGISALVLPIGVILFAFPHYVVYFILGDQWYEAVPIIRLLAAFGVIRALTASTSSLFNAVKKQDYVTYYTLASLIVLAILIVPLTAKDGIFGAATAALIGSFAAIPIILLNLKKLLSKY